MPSPWSLAEVELVVADYFAMLADELAGRPYSKTERRARLRPLLAYRSDGSIEFKHANISAVLINFRFPYIEGYKPRFNYQQLLERVVLERLSVQPAFFEEIERSPLLEPPVPGVTDFSRIDELIEPPPPLSPAASGAVREGMTPRARHVDFVERDAQNRRLGRLGEEWTVEFEARRLHDRERRPDLARRIEWVSDTRGDGLGYDIQSFDADGSPRLIEVKTTGLRKDFPFIVTANEVRVSGRDADRYQLYRLFNFGRAPHLYMLRGDLAQVCRLDPRQYWARPGGDC